MDTKTLKGFNRTRVITIESNNKFLKLLSVKKKREVLSQTKIASETKNVKNYTLDSEGLDHN